MKRPAFQFYPGDWRKDLSLRKCSLAARGLWIELMCIAHECEPYGTLVHEGQMLTAEDIAGLVGQCTPREAQKLLDELIRKRVAKVDADGVIYSKRMVDDERVRNARAEGGTAGSEHGHKGAAHGHKGGRPPKGRGVSEPPLEPPPSSSSSPSSTEIPSEAIASGASAAPPPTPRDVVFAVGVPLLTAAGVVERNARSFLAAQSKAHGDSRVAAALQACAGARPVQPVPWLVEHLGPPAGRAEPTTFRERSEAAAKRQANAWMPTIAAARDRGTKTLEVVDADAPRLAAR